MISRLAEAASLRIYPDCYASLAIYLFHSVVEVVVDQGAAMAATRKLQGTSNTLLNNAQMDELAYILDLQKNLTAKIILR